jgi:N-acetylmuramoyl-L-alanine amidase
MSGFAPDHPGAEVVVSPNFGPRREGVRPDCLILHYTGMETAQAAESRLCAPESEVSAHYLVHEDGRIVQMVRESDRAWHAGKGSWKGRCDVNSFSIGIEIVNCGPLGGFPDFPAVQIEAVAALARDICARHGIAPERVLAHSDIAPGRKIDPGERFPWARLHELGVGHYVPPAPVQGGRFPRRATAASRSRHSSRCCRSTATRWRSTAFSTTGRASRSRHSSAISGRRGSMASPTARPSRRCTGYSPPCLPSRPDRAITPSVTSCHAK